MITQAQTLQALQVTWDYVSSTPTPPLLFQVKEHVEAKTGLQLADEWFNFAVNLMESHAIQTHQMKSGRISKTIIRLYSEWPK